jgi:sRNA-binding protein
MNADQPAAEAGPLPDLLPPGPTPAIAADALPQTPAQDDATASAIPDRSESAAEPAPPADHEVASGAAAAVAPAEGTAEVTAASTADAASAVPASPPEMSAAACARELAERFPALFGAPRPQPLKLRIQTDIQARAPGVFTRRSLSLFLHRYTTSNAYLGALARAPQRVDLDGAPAGEISEEHRSAAAAEIARRRALHAERQAAANAAARAAARAAGGPPTAGGEPGAKADGHDAAAAAAAGPPAGPGDGGPGARRHGPNRTDRGPRPPRPPRPGPGAGPAPGAGQGHGPRGDRPPRADGPFRTDRPARSPRHDRPGRIDRPDSPDRPDRAARAPHAQGQGGAQSANADVRPMPPRTPRPPSSDFARDPARAQAREHPREQRPAAQAGAAAPSSPQEQARRERAALLRSYEESTLAKANFCVLRRIDEAALDAALALAREERRAWQAAHGPAQDGAGAHRARATPPAHAARQERRPPQPPHGPPGKARGGPRS